MDLLKLTSEHLANAHMVQIATVVDGRPWCCSVLYVADENLNLYWMSRPQTRHSQELAANPVVAAAIAVKHDPEGPKIGVQLEGQAQQVTKADELKRAVELYDKKFHISGEWKEALLDGSDPHSAYKIMPRLIVLFDQINFPDNPRQEVKL